MGLNDVNDLNATVIDHTDLHPDLKILRVKPDNRPYVFEAGQFAVLGLPANAKRVIYSDLEEEPVDSRKLIRRAYSISSASRQSEYMEFYLALVRSGVLTPRLFALDDPDATPRYRRPPRA